MATVCRCSIEWIPWVVTVTIDPLNYRTTVLHDALGRVTSYTDAANNTTTYAFDASGRLTSQTDPLGKTTTSVYDAAGRLTALTDRMGREKLFLYDALGRVTSQVWENSGGTPVETMTYSFDANGNMLSTGNSNGAYTVTYDNLNRPATAQDMWSNTLTFGYDALGNRTTVQDSHGGLTTSVYDAIINLTQRKFSDGSSNVRVDHLYDGNGRVTATSRYSDLAGSSKVVAVYSVRSVERTEILVLRHSSAQTASRTDRDFGSQAFFGTNS